mgnify:CR=1 FL=1
MFFLTWMILFVFSSKVESRTCRVVFPERPNDAPKVAYLFDGTQNQEVWLPSMNLSPVIELPDGDLTISMSSDKIIDPEEVPAGIPFLKIAEGVSDFYILITPDKKNDVFPIKMNLVDVGAGKLNPGQTLWFNLTDHRIVAKLGETTMAVKPRRSTVTKAPAPKSGYYEAHFGYQSKEMKELAPITEQYWWHDANSKHIGFIVNTGGKLPKIFFYRDFRVSSEQGTPQE